MILFLAATLQLTAMFRTAERSPAGTLLNGPYTWRRRPCRPHTGNRASFNTLEREVHTNLSIATSVGIGLRKVRDAKTLTRIVQSVARRRLCVHGR